MGKEKGVVEERGKVRKRQRIGKEGKGNRILLFYVSPLKNMQDTHMGGITDV